MTHDGRPSHFCYDCLKGWTTVPKSASSDLEGRPDDNAPHLRKGFITLSAQIRDQQVTHPVFINPSIADLRDLWNSSVIQQFKSGDLVGDYRRAGHYDGVGVRAARDIHQNLYVVDAFYVEADEFLYHLEDYGFHMGPSVLEVKKNGTVSFIRHCSNPLLLLEKRKVARPLVYLPSGYNADLIWSLAMRHPFGFPQS